DLLGVLAIAVGDRDADEDARRRALEHGSTVLAVELSKERAAAEVERRLRGDLVEEVLSGGLDAGEAERLARQAERLGHRLPSRAWVVVMEPDDDRSESEMAARGLQDRLDSALADLVRGRAPGGLTLVRSASAVIIAPEEAVADLQAAEAIGELVMSTVA